MGELGLTFLASAAIEELKADVIGPRVEGQTLNMDPLLALLAVLCGTALLGWEGALIAVPFAAMLQVVFEEVIVPRRLARWDTDGDGSEERAGADAPVHLGVSATTGRRPSVIHFTRG
jgi:predicted PurR-regulated permease PerM